MRSAEQDRVAVVLVRARNPANIGAVARAMHDFGFGDLRVVNEYPVPFQAAKSAVDAIGVLARAREFPQLAEAVADCTFVLGTTAVGERALEHPVHAIGDAGVIVREHLRSVPETRVALLFGSEKTGLTNDALSHCHALATIPMHDPGEGRHLSMNLGQAAAVCLYELGERSTAVPLGERPAQRPATAGDLSRLQTLLEAIFDRSGYARRHPANSREANVRRLMIRLRLSAEDAAVWTGVFRQIVHALPAKRESDESA